MLTGYKEEFKSGFEVTNVLSAMPWSDQLTKRPEEELGWEQLVLRDTNGDLGYQVYFNHRKLRQWGVDVDQLTCNLPQIGDVRDFCENAVKRGFLKAREDVEQLVVVSSIARELMINKEIYERKKSEIRIRNLVPRILGGMFVGSLIGLLPAEGKGRYAKGIVAMLGGLLAYRHTGRFIHWGRSYAINETNKLLSERDLSEAIRVVVPDNVV